MDKMIVNSCIEISKMLITVGKEHEAYNGIASLSDEITKKIGELLSNKNSNNLLKNIKSLLESIQMLTNALDHDDVSFLYDVLRYELPDKICKLGDRT